jgi:disulfide bond formation protein DsbB
MSLSHPFLRWPQAPFSLTLILSVGLVAGGVVMSEVFRLAACPLCVIQRMLYLLLAALAVPGLFLARFPIARRLLALAMAASAGTGVFVAGYQTWLQRFAQAEGCSGYQTWWEEFVDWAGEKVPLLFLSDGICSDPGWKFLSLSIAEWSLIMFSALLALALYATLRRTA